MQTTEIDSLLPEVAAVATQLNPRDFISADEVPAGGATRKSWTARWTIAVLFATLIVDATAVWMVLRFVGPLALLTLFAIAVAGLFLIATRTTTSVPRATV